MGNKGEVNGERASLILGGNRDSTGRGALRGDSSSWHIAWWRMGRVICPVLSASIDTNPRSRGKMGTAVRINIEFPQEQGETLGEQCFCLIHVHLYVLHNNLSPLRHETFSST